MKYPEVIEAKCFNCLENEAKFLLVDQSEGVSVKFFKWIEEKFPEINKITNKERDKLLIDFRCEM